MNKKGIFAIVFVIIIIGVASILSFYFLRTATSESESKDVNLWGLNVSPAISVVNSYNQTSDVTPEYALDGQVAVNEINCNLQLSAEYNPTRVDILNGIRIKLSVMYRVVTADNKTIQNLTTVKTIDILLYAANFSSNVYETSKTVGLPFNISSTEEIIYEVYLLAETFAYKINDVPQTGAVSNSLILHYLPINMNSQSFYTMISVMRYSGIVLLAPIGLGTIKKPKKNRDINPCVNEECDPSTGSCCEK